MDMTGGNTGSPAALIWSVLLPSSFARQEPAMFTALLKAVRRIPRGKVSTYGQVARAAGYPGAARQVVWALRSPAATGVPWHRVVGAGGKILLPGESGLEQRLRLSAEGVSFVGPRILMAQHEYCFAKQQVTKKKTKNSWKKGNRAAR
jgi:methylated-DNA-protein-cysteine methyltransferase-like protein